MYEDAVQIRDRLADLVHRLDPDAVSGSAARELWGVLDASERLCAAGKTLLARRVAQTHQPSSGSRSSAEELARKAGSSTGAAKDALDTSRRLADQPPVEKALRRGELSPAQAALISGAAAADPGQAQRLTELAGRVSLPELREECARVKAAADPDPAATNARLHQGRRLRRWTDTEGFWNLHAKGTPQAGAAFNTVLEALTDQLFHTARREGRHEPPEAYAFDALMAMADQVADRAASDQPATGKPGPDNADPDDADPADGYPDDRGPDDRGPDNVDLITAGGPDDGGPVNPNGAEPSPGAGTADTGPILPAPPAPRLRRPNPRYLALLRVDLEAMRRGRVDGEEVCEIRGVGPVPVSVAAGLLGQAVLKLVITDGVDVLNVTHLGRGPTAAQKITLAWSSPGCTVEGCWRTRVETDHREPWAQTKHTRLDELDPFCGYHHDLKTRFGWALVPGTGKRPMVPPENPRHPRHRAGPETGAAPPAGQTRPADAATGDAAAQPSRTRPAARRTPDPPAQQTLPDPPGDPPRAA